MGSAADWLAAIVALLALVTAWRGERRAKQADERAVRAVEAAERAAQAQERLGETFSDWLSRQEKRDQRQWTRAADVPMARPGQPYAGPIPSGYGRPIPPPRVHWTVDRIHGKRYSLTNLGRGTARDVTVKAENTVRFDGPVGGIDIERGSSVSFMAIGSWQTGTPEIVVTWTDDEGAHEWRRVVA